MNWSEGFGLYSWDENRGLFDSYLFYISNCKDTDGDACHPHMIHEPRLPSDEALGCLHQRYLLSYLFKNEIQHQSSVTNSGGILQVIESLGLLERRVWYILGNSLFPSRRICSRKRMIENPPGSCELTQNSLSSAVFKTVIKSHLHK